MLKKLGLLLIALSTVVQPILISYLPLLYASGTEVHSSTQTTLYLRRTNYVKGGTFGELVVNGHLFYTLEETAVQIPPGTYPVELTYSPKFHRLLPLLSVRHRSNIRIHSGNWPKDSKGCILVGSRKGKDMLLDSRKALDILVTEIQLAVDAGGDVQIVIS